MPDDSEFCQYCGSKMSDAAKQMHPIEENITPERIYLSESQRIVTVPNPIDVQNVKAPLTVPAEKGRQKKWIATVICLSILFLGMTGLNVYQYAVARDQAAKVVELSATIDNLNSTIDKLNSMIEQKDTQIKNKNSEITTLKEKVSSLEDDVRNYDAIVDAVKNGGLGYAAYNFQSSESIIVVGQSEKERKFTLTANWSNGGTVSVDYGTYSPAAYVRFDQDTWTTSTTMTIKPNHIGVTIVTFSNDVNTQTFDVIIIVE